MDQCCTKTKKNAKHSTAPPIAFAIQNSHQGLSCCRINVLHLGKIFSEGLLNMQCICSILTAPRPRLSLSSNFRLKSESSAAEKWRVGKICIGISVKSFRNISFNNLSKTFCKYTFLFHDLLHKLWKHIEKMNWKLFVISCVKCNTVFLVTAFFLNLLAFQVFLF